MQNRIWFFESSPAPDFEVGFSLGVATQAGAGGAPMDRGAHQQGELNCSRFPHRPAGVLAGWRPDESGRAEWRDAGFSPRREGTDLSVPQPDYPLTLTSLSPGERVSRL